MKSRSDPPSNPLKQLADSRDDICDRSVVLKFLRRDFVWKNYDTLGSGFLDELVKITDNCARFFSSFQSEPLSEMKKIFQAVLDVIRCWRNLCQVEFSIFMKKKGPEITKFKNKDEDERENKNYVKTNSSFVTCFLFFSMIKQEGRKMIPATDLGTLRKIRMESRKTFRFLFQLLGGDEIYDMIERFIKHIVKLPNKNFQKLSISALNTLLSLKKSFNHPQIIPILRRHYPSVLSFIQDEEILIILHRSISSFCESSPELIFSERVFKSVIPSLLSGFRSSQKQEIVIILFRIMGKMMSTFKSSAKWMDQYFKKLCFTLLDIDFSSVMLKSMNEEKESEGVSNNNSQQEKPDEEAKFYKVLFDIKVRISMVEVALETATKNQIPFLRDEFFPILLDQVVKFFVGITEVMEAFPYCGIDWEEFFSSSSEHHYVVKSFCRCLLNCFRKVFFFKYFKETKPVPATNEETKIRRLQVEKHLCQGPNPKIRTLCFVLKLLLERMGIGHVGGNGRVLYNKSNIDGVAVVLWIVAELVNFLPVVETKKYIIEEDGYLEEDRRIKRLFRNRTNLDFQFLGEQSLEEENWRRVRSLSIFRPYVLNSVNVNSSNNLISSNGLSIISNIFMMLKSDSIFYTFNRHSFVLYGRRSHHSIVDDSKTCSVDMIMNVLFQRSELHRKGIFPLTPQLFKSVIHNLNQLVFYILKEDQEEEEEEEEEEQEMEEKEKVKFFVKKYGLKIHSMLRLGVRLCIERFSKEEKMEGPGMKKKTDLYSTLLKLRSGIILTFRHVLNYFMAIQEYRNPGTISTEILENLREFLTMVIDGKVGELSEGLKKDYKGLKEWCLGAKQSIENQN